ncbi:MAG TPA: PQQ-binding-like beta-propeller repeat protein [Steroidobacteraceae bacterium]|jgi:alcohol dehydrogenase (cytochrome c)
MEGTGKRLVVVAVLIVLAVAAGLLHLFRYRLFMAAALMINYARSSVAPPGSLTLEAAPVTPDVGFEVPVATAEVPMPPDTALDWPSYNRTLTSARYSPLDQVNRDNVGRLKVLCTYDTGETGRFTTGPIVVKDAIVGTTDDDIFSIDAATCRQRWRTHEHYSHVAGNGNRGAAYLDGRLYRGSPDGRVLAYDFKSGTRLWQTRIANPELNESAPAAPIAWNGLVFMGNAGGDIKGVKGRIYALDATTGKIVWEFYLVPKQPGDPTRGPQAPSPLDTSTWANQADTPITGGATWTSYTLDPARAELYVPSGNPGPDFATGPRQGANLYSGSVVVLDAKTGAYKRHFKLLSEDWHDWDVSNTPILIETRTSKHLLSVAPKDGYLYGFDLDSNALRYRTPVTRIENADATFSTDKAVHFCPGSGGGAEWNSPAFDPQTNLIVTGEVDWCTTVTLQSDAGIRAVPLGQMWPGMATSNPYNILGVMDSYRHWAGWVYATDADTGTWKWRSKSNYPILSGMTPTAGGVVFFGDMGGNFYALEAATGRRLWGKNLGGAIGGGVVTYSAGGTQRVAVAAGYTSVLWPTRPATGKIVILGLPGT